MFNQNVINSDQWNDRLLSGDMGWTFTTMYKMKEHLQDLSALTFYHAFILM